VLPFGRPPLLGTHSTKLGVMRDLRSAAHALFSTVSIIIAYPACLIDAGARLADYCCESVAKRPHKMLRLLCEVKQYAWGQPGKTSLVAALAEANNPGSPIQAQGPYAELWMGAHPSGSSRIAKSGESLLAWLERCPDALGQGVLTNFGRELPFLFKVLSVKTALSIQAHPDKVLAQQLHSERPNVYKDPHHKPELALAVCLFGQLTL
jgi:Phosphomannose isomerase type I